MSLLPAGNGRDGSLVSDKEPATSSGGCCGGVTSQPLDGLPSDSRHNPIVFCRLPVRWDHPRCHKHWTTSGPGTPAA